MPAKYALGGEIHSVSKQDRGGENIYSFFLHTLLQSKSFYISHAVSYFYKTEIEIWAGFGLAGRTENYAKVFYF